MGSHWLKMLNFMVDLCVDQCVFSGPGDSGPAMNQMGPPGQFGPRGPRGPLFRPDARPRFQGPGGPRPNGPFQEQIRGGQMPPRMLGPRPLIPELVRLVGIRLAKTPFKFYRHHEIPLGWSKSGHGELTDGTMEQPLGWSKSGHG